MTVPKRYFLAMAFRKATLEDGVAKGIVKIEGDPGKVAPFFASFDSPVHPIRLTLR
jgi:hypothetical protein